MYVCVFICGDMYNKTTINPVYITVRTIIQMTDIAHITWPMIQFISL